MAVDLKALITQIRGEAATALQLVTRAASGDSQAKSCLAGARTRIQSIVNETGYALAELNKENPVTSKPATIETVSKK